MSSQHIQPLRQINQQRHVRDTDDYRIYGVVDNGWLAPEDSYTSLYWGWGGEQHEVGRHAISMEGALTTTYSEKYL